MSRIELRLTVVESDPVVEIYSPFNNQFYEPGEIVIIDSNGTFDADNDPTKREWRLYPPTENNPEVLSNNAYFETKMHQEYTTSQYMLKIEEVEAMRFMSTSPLHLVILICRTSRFQKLN